MGNNKGVVTPCSTKGCKRTYRKLSKWHTRCGHCNDGPKVIRSSIRKTKKTTETG